MDLLKMAKKLSDPLPMVDLSFTHQWLPDLSLQSYVNHPSPSPRERHRIQATDGVEIDLWHFTSSTSNQCPPVLLVHGLASNHRIFTFPRGRSLIHNLRERGFDCWALDLRGHGNSEVPDQPWNFDDYLRKDLPSAVDYIIEQGPHEQIHWIGHSMGGMLYLAYEGVLDREETIASGVTIGSPVKFYEQPTVAEKIGALLHLLPAGSRSIPVADFFSWMGLLPQVSPYLPRFPLVNHRNVPDRTLSEVASVGFSRTSSRILTQYAYWIVRDEWTSETGDVNYRQSLQSVKSPTLMLAGRVDPLCFTRTQAGFRKLGTDKKRFFLASREAGLSDHYSHVDLVIGDQAHQDVFPEITQWLQRYSNQSRQRVA